MTQIKYWQGFSQFMQTINLPISVKQKECGLVEQMFPNGNFFRYRNKEACKVLMQHRRFVNGQ